jgi:hypothetical protein
MARAIQSESAQNFTENQADMNEENILAGWAVWAVGLGLFSTLDEKSGVGKQIGYGLLAGFGLGQTLQP